MDRNNTKALFRKSIANMEIENVILFINKS